MVWHRLLFIARIVGQRPFHLPSQWTPQDDARASMAPNIDNCIGTGNMLPVAVIDGGVPVMVVGIAQ